ncbi:MAG: biotin--[acetyl-CoA-carboxylase] ligase [Pseudomonadota bacterium]|nr:biotin--[acetyl-CoA-carboxylase] ligase [Pseudomonadota bacterium]
MPTLTWPTEALRAALAPHAGEGVWVDVLPAVDSTNSELMRRARAGDTQPTLLVAEAQTAGRGRLGRAWQSGPVGSALAFSLGLPLAPQDWSGLSLAVGLALADALHDGVRIKWPNDLWWQGRKLAGILIETTAAPGLPDGARHAVIGVGLNVDAPDGTGLSTAPAWTREFAPALDAPALLLRLAAPLLAAVRAFEAQGFAPLQARFAARDALAGRPVRLSDGTEGQALGVSAQGALRVQTTAGVRDITSAEVSVRPLTPPAPAPETTP